MPLFRHAGRWPASAALCLLAVPALAGVRLDPDPAWRSAGSAADLAPVLEDWLDRKAPWPRRETAPAIRVISPEWAARLGGPPPRGHGPPRGLYDEATATIYLVEPWTPEDAEDASVLLHELAHHRQAPHHWICPGAQELPAYRLQEAWLAERGLEADVTWFAVVLEAGCGPKDFHPD